MTIRPRRAVRLGISSLGLVAASALLAYLRIEGHIHWPWWLILLPISVVIGWAAIVTIIVLAALGFLALGLLIRRFA